MLPAVWQTSRLVVQDAAHSDLGAAHQCLAESEDIGQLDPAFKLVPPAEIETHITRSAEAASLPQRTFQMQMLRLKESGEVVGYWHFMAVPKKPSAVGVSIMLVRPAHRRQGLGRELILGSLPRFDASMQEVWARVYLGNPRALEFWASLGFVNLVRLHETYVSAPAEQPSIILAMPLGHRTDDA